MNDPNSAGRSLETSYAASVAIDNELTRRDADANRGSFIHLLGGVIALPSLVWLQPEQDYLRKMQALGVDPTQYSQLTGVSYWLQQAANLPIDYKGAAFATAAATAAYGARLVSRRHRFPIDQDKAYAQLSKAVSYDSSQAGRYVTRRKIGDVAVGVATAGAAYAIGEQLDTLNAVVATVTASMVGFTVMLGSKLHTAVYKARWRRAADVPIERPRLEDGKTIH